MFDYDPRFYPPAPVLPLQVSSTKSSPPVSLFAMLDSGADMTVLPHTVVRNLGLRRLYFTHAHGFGAAKSDHVTIT